ncbi:hypothetical protein ATCV1_z705R [Acanthocystis turfacea chlorella virus 1]|uniref:Uncharacterized protein z705R n=1 Tax=Chlorovirus heliozoae TaxID=322019 RepID=A7K9W5_9PHYC|nr:hypothetical protein ATCV1_z705R [Acanthocystis turfacea chlorella virus 1]ABT16839.1 hypothetical protein ATCV1_z705R [Acanthocystis turfacea chlorella virus 1]
MPFIEYTTVKFLYVRTPLYGMRIFSFSIHYTTFLFECIVQSLYARWGYYFLHELGKRRDGRFTVSYEILHLYTQPQKQNGCDSQGHIQPRATLLYVPRSEHREN